VRLGKRLGFGRDGEVYSTDRNTAVKFFTVVETFSRERRAYEILAENQISHVAGHAVPEMIRVDESLMAIEMTIVQPPFLLDFALAYAESEAPHFPEEVWEDWRQQKSEEFGSRWPDVEFILSEFHRLTGLVLLDTNLGNIQW
jgi:hypothetical protein